MSLRQQKRTCDGPPGNPWTCADSYIKTETGATVTIFRLRIQVSRIPPLVRFSTGRTSARGYTRGVDRDGGRDGLHTALSGVCRTAYVRDVPDHRDPVPDLHRLRPRVRGAPSPTPPTSPRTGGPALSLVSLAAAGRYPLVFGGATCPGSA